MKKIILILVFICINCKSKDDKLNLIGVWYGNDKEHSVRLEFKVNNQCSLNYSDTLPIFNYQYKVKNDTLVLNNKPFGVLSYANKVLNIKPIKVERDIELIYEVDFKKITEN